MNPRVHSEIMTLSPESESESEDSRHWHPFRYARILGIFHVDVVHAVPGSQAVFKTMEFLWVRWFEYDNRWRAGLNRRRLHRIRFVQQDHMQAYGFLDPDDVIHGMHLIPAFTHSQNNNEYNYFYVNM